MSKCICKKVLLFALIGCTLIGSINMGGCHYTRKWYITSDHPEFVNCSYILLRYNTDKYWVPGIYTDNTKINLTTRLNIDSNKEVKKILSNAANKNLIDYNCYSKEANEFPIQSVEDVFVLYSLLTDYYKNDYIRNQYDYKDNSIMIVKINFDVVPIDYLKTDDSDFVSVFNDNIIKPKSLKDCTNRNTGSNRNTIDITIDFIYLLHQAVRQLSMVPFPI